MELLPVTYQLKPWKEEHTIKSIMQVANAANSTKAADHMPKWTPASTLISSLWHVDILLCSLPICIAHGRLPHVYFNIHLLKTKNAKLRDREKLIRLAMLKRQG